MLEIDFVLLLSHLHSATRRCIWWPPSAGIYTLSLLCRGGCHDHCICQKPYIFARNRLIHPIVISGHQQTSRHRCCLLIWTPYARQELPPQRQLPIIDQWIHQPWRALMFSGGMRWQFSVSSDDLAFKTRDDQPTCFGHPQTQQVRRSARVQSHNSHSGNKSTRLEI